MTIIQTIILGIVEGITEFLPVSSTFHLIWTSRLLNLAQTDVVKLFEVAIQSGAILAVVLLYWKELITNVDLMKKLIVSFIPIAIVGFFFYDFIKSILFDSLLFTTLIFILVGIAFLVVEYLIRKGSLHISTDIRAMSYRDALLIGVFQAFAVIPGISRAGAVLVIMLIRGYERSESAKYSFMLSIPTILAASVFDMSEMQHVLAGSPGVAGTVLIGSIVSFISAYIGIRWLIRYLQQHTLDLFGWYRIGVGIILLLALVA